MNCFSFEEGSISRGIVALQYFRIIETINKSGVILLTSSDISPKAVKLFAESG
jgi:hypothetical protein